MKDMKGWIVLLLSASLMGLLTLIVVDEFMIASETDEGFDQGILSLLNNALVGVVGIVGAYLGSKGNS